MLENLTKRQTTIVLGIALAHEFGIETNAPVSVNYMTMFALVSKDAKHFKNDGNKTDLSVLIRAALKALGSATKKEYHASGATNYFTFRGQEMLIEFLYHNRRNIITVCHVVDR